MTARGTAPSSGAIDGAQPAWLAYVEGKIEPIIGRPSWFTNLVILPSKAGKGQGRFASDWQKFAARCAEERLIIRKMSLWIPGFGFFESDEDKGAYGYFEKYREMPDNKLAVVGLGLCWPGKFEGIVVVKSFCVSANGQIEARVHRGWQPCLIGEQLLDDDPDIEEMTLIKTGDAVSG